MGDVDFAQIRRASLSTSGIACFQRRTISDGDRSLIQYVRNIGDIGGIGRQERALRGC